MQLLGHEFREDGEIFFIVRRRNFRTILKVVHLDPALLSSYAQKIRNDFCKEHLQKPGQKAKTDVSSDHWEVSEIVGERQLENGVRQFKVRWVGCWDDDWINEENLNCPYILYLFRKTNYDFARKFLGEVVKRECRAEAEFVDLTSPRCSEPLSPMDGDMVSPLGVEVFNKLIHEACSSELVEAWTPESHLDL